MAFRAAVLSQPDAEVCRLCDRVRCVRGCCERANSVDHVLPVKTHPELCYSWTNVQPAHRCCNSSRGAGPMRGENHSREW
jgi:hypothetical protein